MECTPGRRGGGNYHEEEDSEKPLNRRPGLALTYAPSSSSCSAPELKESRHQHHTSGSCSAPADLLPHPAVPFVQKEHMFDKVVTPSDVGKLNRLVIPKQHAEKYLPIDAFTNEKGLLLCFEDRTGKPWRFRYSYWNSSQSYVITKGWSRFVKEKRLDAGDTVSFGRGVGEAGRHRLFIDWKRRPDSCDAQRLLPLSYHPSSPIPFAQYSGAVRWGGVVVPPPSSAMGVYGQLAYGYGSAVAPNPYVFLRSSGTPSHVAVQLGISSDNIGRGGDGGLAVPLVFDSVQVVQRSAAAAKTVRLFGVNLDCSPSEGDPDGHALRTLPPPQLSLGTGDGGIAGPGPGDDAKPDRRMPEEEDLG